MNVHRCEVATYPVPPVGSIEIAESAWIKNHGSIDGAIAAAERYRHDLNLIGELLVHDEVGLAECRRVTGQLVRRLKDLKFTTKPPEPGERVKVSKERRFFRSKILDGDEVVYFFDYHTKRRSGNSERGCLMSDKIRALKSMNKQAIAFFTSLLRRRLVGDFSVCIVPSHKRTKKSNGIKEVAVNLTRKGTITDATDCLERFRTIPKQSISHRKRNIDMHLESVRIKSGYSLKGKYMLLLDDVGTSGWSIAACRRILEAADSARVKCVVLGRTVNKSGENVTNEMRRAIMVH